MLASGRLGVFSAWRLVGLLRTLGVLLGAVALLFVAAAPAAWGDVWNVEGGVHSFETDTGETIKTWSARQWQVWRKQVQSLGECMGLVEHCAVRELAGETPVEDFSRLTPGAAQEGVGGARSQGEALGGEVQDALDLAGEDAETLPLDLGADAVAHAKLGPERRVLGVELGNGLDQLFEAPAHKSLTEAEEHELSEQYNSEHITAHTTAREEEVDRELNPNGVGEVPDRVYWLAPGEYLEQPGLGPQAFGNIEEGTECTEPHHQEGCKPFHRQFEGEYVPPGFTRRQAVHNEGEYFPDGVLIQYGVAVYEVMPLAECPVITTARAGEIGAKGAVNEWTCAPLGVPAPNLIDKHIEENNLAAGLPARPKDESPVTLPTVPPSPLSEGDLQMLSENTVGREDIEAMFRSKAREEAELADKELELFGTGPEGEPPRQGCKLGHTVNCATGNETQTLNLLAVGGRGPKLDFSLTYNSELASASKAAAGAYGFGWSGSFSAHTEYNAETGIRTVAFDDGASVSFVKEASAWVPISGLVQATLAETEGLFVLTLADQTKLHFNAAGNLASEEDRDGNKLTISRGTEERVESVSDEAGRKLTFAYGSEGVESVTDPMGHKVKLTHGAGNLATITLPGEEKARWSFKYDSAHEMTAETDGRTNTTEREYAEGKVASETDPLKRKRAWKYTATETGSETTITEPNGSTTVEKFNEAGSPTSVTHASGTSISSTSTWEYDGIDQPVAYLDPDNHKTEYTYDEAGDRTSEKNGDGDETKWEYNATHDVIGVTRPNGEKTTIKREAHGNPEAIERPAPGGKTQTVKYKYSSHGELESLTTPLETTYKYEYDGKGDRTAEIDPEGNKRTREYNEDSQQTATVSPRGTVSGGKPSEFTIKTERDAQGRIIKVTEPLGRVTEYKYDGDGNVEKVTDANKHTTTRLYDTDNELTKVEEPNKAVSETEYDSMGQVVAQIDGNKHKTKYARNALEQVTEITDPLGHVTTKEYDAAGNLVKLTDPAKRTTSYTYDPANRLTEVSYSSGKPAAVKYEYNKDGERTKLTDGTGTTTYSYDELDRLTETENGNKEVVKYEYDLANDQTKITYPNGKALTRAFDKDGRLETVTDWLSHTTKFSYNEDSKLKATVFPSETKDEDEYVYNNADEVTEAKMVKGSETLASLVYTRGNDGEVKKTTAKKLPGSEITEATYDENNRLTKYGSTEYKYDAANNPTTEGTASNTFNEANELEKSTGVGYTYDELGERTKATPEKGPATTYSYDQADDLASVERPEGESQPKIEDTYAYNGDGLRVSETTNGSTKHLAWDLATDLPLILSNETSSIIYGPEDMPIEQINNTTGAVLYLHHDEAGSTRLLTGSTGKTEGSYSYGAYGTPEHSGTATTPLGYDGQYTSSDTGLIYLRAREYDPATAQFLSVDPLVWLTRAPYTYAGDNPLNFGDPSGRAFQICVGGTVSLGFFSVEGNVCYVNTPHGEGVAISGGASRGPGLGANVHVGAGGSNAQTPEEYGGPFANVGGSAQAGFGGYAGAFFGPGGSCTPVVAGGTAGVSAGIGAEAGVGASYTEVIPF